MILPTPHGVEGERFEARATTLKELIEHHVKEEEDDLFPKVEKALGKEKLEELGATMSALFETLVAVDIPTLALDGEVAHTGTSE